MEKITVEDLTVEVVRKRIRNFYLRVYPDGRVCVTTSIFQSEGSIRRQIEQKMGWIMKKMEQYTRSSLPAKVQMIDGEMHDFLGKSYQLKLSQSARAVLRDESAMTLTLPHDSKERLEALLHLYYKKQLSFLLPSLLDKWEPVVGVKVAAVTVKKLKSCWGSCNIQKKRITLNLELSKKPLACIEYVLVHELAHLHERLHNKRFWSLVEKFMPDWRIPHGVLHGKRSIPKMT